MSQSKVPFLLLLALVGVCVGFGLGLAEQTTKGSDLDRFGDRLPPGALLRLGTERLRHNGRVLGVAFAQDGKMLASVGWENSVSVWDRRTGKRLFDLGNSSQGYGSAAFSPDGTQLAAGGRRGDVTMWEVGTGKTVFNQKDHSDAVHALAFSHDGRTFATAGGNVCIWNSATGANILNLPPPPKYRPGLSQGVAFSADGKLLAASFLDQIHVWDMKRGTPPLVIAKAHIPAVTSLVFSDNATLISGGESTVLSWDVATGNQVRELKAESGHGGSLALSSDRKILCAAYVDKIRIWNNLTGKSIRVIGDYRNNFTLQPHNLAISPDGEMLAAGAEDNVVQMWNVVTGKQAPSFSESHTGRMKSVAYSPDSRHVLTGADRSVRLWDASNATQVRSFSFPDTRQVGEMVATFSADGKTIAGGGYADSPKNRFTGLCYVWDAVTGKVLRTYEFPHRVTALAFAANGKTLAIATWNSNDDRCSLFVWDLSTGKPPIPMTTDRNDLRWLAFLPNSNTLAAIQQGQLRFWNIGTKEEQASLGELGTVNSAAFFPDGKTLVTGGWYGGELVVWDVANRTDLYRMEVKNTLGNMVALSPDGRILASAPIPRSFTDYEFDGSIRLWEMVTGREIRKIEIGNSKVTTLAFAPTGRTLASGLENGTALIWNVKLTNAKVLSPKELEQLWADLAGTDARQAYSAIAALIAVPDTSVPFLKDRMPPNPELPVARVRALIAELESGKFLVREAAYKELEKLEEKAAGLLREALAKNPTLEVRRRVESLLTAARKVRSADTLRRLRAIQVLEDIGSDGAWQVLGSLARGFPLAWETKDARASLERLGKRP